MQRFASLLVPTISVGVALFLIYLLYEINKIEDIETHAKRKTSFKNDIGTEKEASWLSRFSKSEKLGYFYPVNEIYIDLDLVQKVFIKRIYRLKAVIKDPYQLFCLKEELKSTRLRYLLRREKRSLFLLINSADRAKLDDLVVRLKKYQITASIMPYKEEKEWKNIK